MDFVVYEYSIWDPQQLCLNSNMFLDVLEVEGTPCCAFSPASTPGDIQDLPPLGD